MSVNKAILIGNLGQDPEAKQVNDKTVVNFSLATSEKRGDDMHTTWHRVVVWGKLAEICSQYLKKGSKVYVEGKIQNRQWEEDGGVKRNITEILANTVQFLDKKED